MTHCTVGGFLQNVCVFNLMMFYMCTSNGKYWKEKLTFLFKQRVGDYCGFKGSFKILFNLIFVFSIISAL